MPQEPKKRHSRQRQGKRRASIHLQVTQSILCPNCKAHINPHTICKMCGYYRGKQVLQVKRKTGK
ncbi:MAG: 50S ribosomal protein L32 [Candidatus Levybacteria bacterium]|nr:50S ribosomal protein L32 [Candidatus Levybacteria bacterium]